MAAKLVPRNNSGCTTFEEPDDENDQCDDDFLHELQPLIDEVKRLPETCKRQLPCVQNPEHPEEIPVENVVDDFSQKIEALNDDNDRKCADCSKARRVESMLSLQRGQHISIPGQHSSHYFRSLGKRISAYRHHGIVKRIVRRSRHTAEVILIHFYKEDEVIKVREQTRTFDLQYDELYIIEYKCLRYGPDTIVQRAESILKQSENGELFKGYNPFTKNCEHFATWCVLGEEKSLQAHTFINDIKQMLWSIFGGATKIARLILKILVNASDEIASFLTKAINVPLVVLGISSAAYIIYCIIKTVYLIKQYRNDKTICWHCLKEKLLDLWLQLGAFGLTSAITFGIVNFALPLLAPGIAITIATVLVLVATALTWAVPRIRKALWSPVQYSEKEIKTLSEIKLGDVASLRYYGFRHLVVVSEVKWDNNPKQGTVRGIHYSLPALFDTREIAEENFPVDLERSKVNLVQFNSLCTFSAEEVVDRARKRIGERKWNMSSNLSDHLCQWAKVKSEDTFEETECLENEETGNTQSGSLSSLLVSTANVHLMNDIQLGDVVEYRSDKGIVVKLEDMKDGRVFCMHVVIRKSRLEYYGVKVIHRIDLKEDYLVVHKYHPVHCVSRGERVKKAIGMIGKTIQCWTQTGFVEDIILRSRENK